MTHDCAHQGHVWLEENGQPFVRHRGRPKDSVIAVKCKHCPSTAKVSGYAAFVPPPGPHTVDHQIPAPFKTVLDRAVATAKAADATPTPRPDAHDLSAD